MSLTLLYPMTLSAKVVLNAAKVPALFSGPFNREATLEKGIHLHWALPDSMTAALMISDKGKQSAVFPAVPDLWLVTRFNPGASSVSPFARRTSVSWVVDSVAETVTPLAQWNTPKRDTSQVHTLAGVLPDASSVGKPGMGLWDADPAKHPGGKAVFDPSMAAYYPQARGRLGFYDDLAGLPAQGNVSYLVVGWFSSQKHDPIAVANSTRGAVNQWQASLDLPSASLRSISTPVSAITATPAVAKQNWGIQPKLAQVALPDAARLRGVQRLKLDLDSAQVNLRSETMTKLFPQPTVASTPPPIAPSPVIGAAGPAVAGRTIDASQWARTPLTSAGLRVSFETLVHGSVYNVPLGGATTAPAPLQPGNVTLYPNVKRAMAAVGATGNDATKTDAMEMMLADLQPQSGTTGGIVDIPGATHAATFQSVPGKAKTYLRIDVEAAPATTGTGGRKVFTVNDFLRDQAVSVTGATVTANDPAVRAKSGYWPSAERRTVADAKASRATLVAGLQFKKQPNLPTGPKTDTQKTVTDQMKQDFANTMKASFAAAVQAASASGVTVDTLRLRVQDSRKNARSLGLGPTTDDSGSDAAGWWIDVGDDTQWGQLLVTTQGANVSVPNAGNTYAQPGPRWYRSWSPQVVLKDVGRTYKFGFDTRFRPDKKVLVRSGGNTVSRMTVGSNAAVSGLDLLANATALRNAALPATVLSLAAESVLFDPESASVMAASITNTITQGLPRGGIALPIGMTAPPPPQVIAARTKAQTDFSAAVQGLWYARDPGFNKDSLKPVSLVGEQPSPLALTPWKDPFDPVFVDSNYAHLPTALDQWKVNEGDADFTLVKQPPVAGAAVALQERSTVTATVVNVLQSALVTSIVIDPYGNKIKKSKPPGGLTEQTFTQMDVVSAPLTGYDPGLVQQGQRLRAGTLQMNSLELVDMFGYTRSWAAPAQNNPATVVLPPRLPYWSRYNFRLTSAADPTKEADATAGPICGVLLPDFLEHALEVFDGEGNGLGQLTSTPPAYTAGSAHLSVTWTPHPWLEPNPDRFFHIQNPTLKALVQSLEAQRFDFDGQAQGLQWRESGLTAMLRVIDTVRGTFAAGGVTTPDRKIALMGKPVLVMGARLSFQGAATENTSDLSGDPPPMQPPPDMPAVTVRLGDASRPDDGVLGLFVPGATPGQGRFAPVSADAAKFALLNAVTSVNSKGWLAVTHPFVSGECVVQVPANSPVDVVLLADVDQAIYATCGALPRKRIAIPRDFADAAIRHLEPSFYAGPVLVTEEFDSEKVLLPPPEVAGYQSEFYYRDNDGTFEASDMPAAPPLGDLPKTRVTLSEGWLRLTPVKQTASSGG